MKSGLDPKFTEMMTKIGQPKVKPGKYQVFVKLGEDDDRTLLALVVGEAEHIARELTSSHAVAIFPISKHNTEEQQRARATDYCTLLNEE
jgi:hypothetical protein